MSNEADAVKLGLRDGFCGHSGVVTGDYWDVGVKSTVLMERGERRE